MGNGWPVHALLCAAPQAVVATAELHSSSEAAQRIVPAVAPLAADPIQDVRPHALIASRYLYLLIPLTPLIPLYKLANVSDRECVFFTLPVLLTLPQTNP